VDSAKIIDYHFCSEFMNEHSIAMQSALLAFL
jgi:hypothetical protein